MGKTKLKNIRTEILHLSQEELAHKLGITTAAWASKERYVRPLKAVELIEIARLASLDPREIELI
jgi:DNA-binding XRE family transcriptional regulator